MLKKWKAQKGGKERSNLGERGYLVHMHGPSHKEEEGGEGEGGEGQ